ncbi:Endonuclease/exonuclease/phosphatase [Marasmius fiardii PR-910]|nr:Endonuclease/exonuclease/phosphatase [Marasmius fiardii PR-910]
MASKRVLTADQLALQEARKLKKARAALAQDQSSPSENPRAKILERQWYRVEGQLPTQQQGTKVLTWNLLAQCLVRRELFPTSDCLKAGQREHMIFNEVLACRADILCLQEVDRLEKLLPILEKAGYSHRYASGPTKKHGCLIAYNRSLYEDVGGRTICYDEQEIRSDGEENFRRGSSFRTKNIGHIVSLKRTHGDGGIIVATTHLFWHPKYVYERARQAGILKREVVRFRDSENHPDWPCIIAGDFNFTPDDPAYALVVGDRLLPAQIEQLKASYVVHATIDQSLVDGSSQKEDENEETPDPDRVIVNARPVKSSDGLLSPEELVTLFAESGPPLRSMYDIGLRLYKDLLPQPPKITERIMTFGDRVTLETGRRGAHEPQWTSYTYYWQNSIDYVFVIDPPSVQSTTVGLLSPPKTSDLEPGIPRQGVSGSDHVSLCAEIAFVQSSAT